MARRTDTELKAISADLLFEYEMARDTARWLVAHLAFVDVKKRYVAGTSNGMCTSRVSLSMFGI